MSPSEQCKELGIKSLKEVSLMTDVSIQTLINWHKNKPNLFKIVLAGCAANQTNPLNS